MASTVPEWAVRALAAFAPAPGFNQEQPDPEVLKRHGEFCDKIKRRWLELEIEFIPALNGLTDTGKQLVFEQAIYAAKYQSNQDLKGLREAKKKLDDINEKIRDKAIELSELLAVRDQLRNDFQITDGVPSLFDLIGCASERYPAWSAVSQKEIQDFRRFILTRCQSRPKPGISDLLECLAMNIEPASKTVNDPVIYSQKSQADRIRAILLGTRSLAKQSLDEHGINKTFSLPASAVAALVNVVFDLHDAELVDANTVRQRRQKANKGTCYDFG